MEGDRTPLKTEGDDTAVLEAQAVGKHERWRATKRVLRHVLAIAFWSYIFLKLFILDVDEVLVREVMPNETWLVQYRGVLILGVLAVLAVFAWRQKLLGWILYVAFYPFILAIWHVPSWIYRHRAWTLAIALLAATVSAIRALRWTLILAGCFSVGALLIAAGISGPPLVIGIVLIGACLVIVYLRTIVEAFRSSMEMFSSQSLDKIWSFVSRGFKPADDVKGVQVEAMTDAQRNLWTASLQMSVLYGRVCYLAADKLRNLRQARVTAAISAVKVAGLFVATVVFFSLMNLGLYKYDHTQYLVTGTVRGFDFFWYAFQASFMNGVSEVTPVGMAARAVFMLNELTTGLILFVIVVFLVTGVQAARHADEMDALIAKIRDHAQVSDAFVAEQFGMTVMAAVQELLRLRAGMIGWILRLSPELDPGQKDDD